MSDPANLSNLESIVARLFSVNLVVDLNIKSIRMSAKKYKLQEE